jgi:hypothetical protein
MNKFEKIKSLNKKEMANFLKKATTNPIIVGGLI